MPSKLFLKFFIASVLGLIISQSNAYAYTCPDASNPEVVSTDCTQIVVRNNKSAITVNNGVTVSDGGIGSSYGPVSVTYPNASVNVGTFTNNGTITNTYGGSFSGIQIVDGSSVTNLVNNGTISTMASSDHAGLKVTGSITTLTNNGTISGSTGANGINVYANGNIGALTNSANGQINAGSGSPAILISGGTFSYPASIGTITNLGAIQGIQVQSGGSVGTLNNAQNGLSYSGTLPSNYNIIINSLTSYGGLAGSSLNSGTQTTFGISPLSAAFTPGVTTYTNVLSGMTSANLTSLTGTYGGAFVTTQWQLVAASNQFNLVTNTPTSTAAIISNTSSGQNLSNTLATSYNSIVSGQKQNFMVNLTPAAAAIATAGSPTNAPVTQAAFTAVLPQITNTQAQQLQQVHAEGYSSNMTIGLEQMAHITNTVMDRIHAPMSASPSTKVYQDDEGRYIWADAAAVKGTVNNYNNLAGFGYNLYDIIFGGDIKRSKDGGFGVFAGTGSTSMTESQQVTQNFNTTNFYAGLYGARNFDAQVKLSGALGYMYGNTNANRSMPDVGPIAGSNATSSYKTNGLYGAAKLAKAYQAESFTISPFVGASYSQLWMGGATEQGGNPIFNYSIAGSTAYTAVTFAGADFIYPLLKGTNDPLSLIGFYKFGYDWYANSNSAHSITASGPTGSFTQVGANMGPVSNMVGLGIQGGITKEISARIGAVASYNTYGHEYGGGAELRFKF